MDWFWQPSTLSTHAMLMGLTSVKLQGALYTKFIVYIYMHLQFIPDLHADNVATAPRHVTKGEKMPQKDAYDDILPTPLSGVFCRDCGISSLYTCMTFQGCSIISLFRSERS